MNENLSKCTELSIEIQENSIAEEKRRLSGNRSIRELLRNFSDHDSGLFSLERSYSTDPNGCSSYCLLQLNLWQIKSADLGCRIKGRRLDFDVGTRPAPLHNVFIQKNLYLIYEKELDSATAQPGDQGISSRQSALIVKPT